MELKMKLQFSGSMFEIMIPQEFSVNCFTRNPHTHSHTKYEFHFVRSGRVKFISAEQEILCPQWSVLLIPQNLEHRIYQMDDEAVTDTFLYAPEKTSGKDAIYGAVCAEKPMMIESLPEIPSILERIRQRLEKRENMYLEMVRGEMTLVFAHIAGAIRCKCEEKTEYPDEQRAEYIQKYIAGNCFDPDCSCQTLARDMHLSERQIHRLCIRFYSMPFRALLMRMKMEIAQYRLKNTDDTVGDLAQEMGYQTTAAFSAAYKRYFGYSPSGERFWKKT